MAQRINFTMTTPIVWVFAHCHNEAPILPFWLRHYAAFAEQIHVFDDHSDDGTRDLLIAHPKVTVHDWPGKDGMDETLNLKIAAETYPMARGHADWVMWPDMDEFLYHPDILGYLSRWHSERDVLYPWGFNMLSPDGLPPDDGHSQLWELIKEGVPAPVYSKPVIFQPYIKKIQWIRGKHQIHSSDPVLRIGTVPTDNPSDEWAVKLLHYRFLGVEYTRERNRRNYARAGIISGDKGFAWGVAPNYHGEGSPYWVQQMLPNRYNVVVANAGYIRQTFHLP
jgi:hypothetical protein